MRYHVNNGNHKVEYASAADFWQAWQNGQVEENAHLWHSGMTAWQRVKDLKIFTVVTHGSKSGPLSEAEICAQLNSGTLLPTDLFWVKGMPDWQKLESASRFHAEVAPPRIPGSGDQPWFLTISIRRLLLMGLATMGIFNLYWLYCNWKFIKHRDHLNVMPFWRSVFGVFFIYSLFAKIKDDRQLGRLEAAAFSAGWLAAIWIILNVIGSQLSNFENVYLAVGGIATSCISILCFVPVQKYINKVNAARKPQVGSSPWTLGQWIFLVIGLGVWGLSLIGIAAGPLPTGGTGSGFFITNAGHIVTNAHVVDGADSIQAVFKDQTLDAEVITMDRATDLAILKVTALENTDPLPISPSGEAKLGTSVATVGYPNTDIQGRSLKVSKGEISSLAGIQDDPRFFQISAPIQPGNSGGALFDSSGNVVGIVCAKINAPAILLTMGYIPENVNYAVKSSLLLLLIDTIPGLNEMLHEPQGKGTDNFEDTVERAKRSAVFIVTE